jgi:hypothetical protein
MGEGRCQAWIIKYQTPFVKTDYFGDSINAYASSVEYEDQCSCEQFTNVKPNKRPRRKTLLEMDKQTIDFYIPQSMKRDHHGLPI